MATTATASRAREMRFHGDAAVEAWLWFVAALVVAMVVVGGATRLTDSGLSITEWQPILGAIPPLNEADWLTAFEKYKQIPEYHIVNKGMELQAFKSIFWWEWSHRFLGRFIGMAFALPLAIFWLTGRLRSGLPSRLAGVLALGGLQGAIGWYMVSSGLADRVDVSQYRLALHLATAFAILALLVWLALDERNARSALRPSHAADSIRALSPLLIVALAVQIVLGAFVAGLKAGLIYNTWPDMNGRFIPTDYWLDERGILSIFESLAAAQFNHRIGAYLVFAVTATLLWRVLKGEASGGARRSALVLAAAVVAQITIGIATLLHHVPLSLGLLHQGAAAIVLAIAVWHLYTVRQQSDL